MKKIENVSEEIMAENFSSLKKETDIQVQEVQRVPNRNNWKSITSRYIVIKMTRLNIERENNKLYTRAPP